jgi:hypothetical protein
MVEHLGSDTLAVVGYPFGDLVVRLPASAEPPVGEPLGVARASAVVHLFDGATGQERS